ncbi:unnamed protein product [Rotaria magnacalcarata]|uniref:Uncharacterized protein n=1 Tax=Rotaria magnacalcarata TaxID=392030 RepID=A0A8S2X570_9BILA|nr:unnamed protein product [Rotaria magnacalcarata]CAF4475817.1 unnamed protein product [Rotaria magnacalcarata]
MWFPQLRFIGRRDDFTSILIIDSSKDAMLGLIYMWNFRLMCGCGFLVDSNCFNYEDHRLVSFNLRVPTAVCIPFPLFLKTQE